jgi:uncharacterized protein (DUF2147 family)
MTRWLVWCVLLLTCAGHARAEDGIFGQWWTPGFNARVEIFRCGERACGVITWAWDPKPPGITDEKPLVGQAILRDLEKSPDHRWHGKIYNPEDGRTYSSEIALSGADTLEVNGCVMMFCRRQVWRRYDASRCPPVAP